MFKGEQFCIAICDKIQETVLSQWPDPPQQHTVEYPEDTWSDPQGGEGYLAPARGSAPGSEVSSQLQIYRKIQTSIKKTQGVLKALFIKL